MFGNFHYYLGKKMLKKWPRKLSKNQEMAFLAGEVLCDIGRCYLDGFTGIATDCFEFVNIMKKVAKTNEEKYFILGFEAHIIQDNETDKLLENIFGIHDRRAYIFKCSCIEKYCSMRFTGILYNNCLNRFNFNQVANALIKSGFDIDSLSKKYNIPPKLTKIYIRLILIWKSLIYPKISLITCNRLIQKTYQFLKFEVSENEISRQIGNLLGIFIIASHFDKTDISEKLTSKIEREFDELSDFCISKLDIQNRQI